MGLDAYKDLYRSSGKEITDEEAREAQHNLVNFFKALIEANQESRTDDADD